MIVHIIFHGRVQGVGFRYSVLQKALEHKVTGWVMNKDDGTVELEAEGTETQLVEFVQSLKQFPNRFIKVSEEEIAYKSIERGFKKFQVR